MQVDLISIKCGKCMRDSLFEAMTFTYDFERAAVLVWVMAGHRATSNNNLKRSLELEWPEMRPF
jgi:hypothetical protein